MGTPGNEQADPHDFWTWADGFRPYFKGVVYQVLGNQLQEKVDASDIVQQSLLAVFKNFDQLRGSTPEQRLAWIARIVRNEALDTLRYFSQQTRDFRREQPLAAGLITGRPLGDDSSGPPNKMLRRERAARLLAVLERLPEDFREVVQLRTGFPFGEVGLPFADVAARMGRSEDAARQLWVRAVRQLRGELGDDL